MKNLKTNFSGDFIGLEYNNTMYTFNKRAPIVIWIILVIFGISYLKPQIQNRHLLNTNNSYQFLRLNILKIIKMDGVPKTTNRVVAAFKNGDIDINECHNLMHTLGHSAYEFNPNNWDILISPQSTTCFYGFEHGVEAQIFLSKAGDTETMYKELHNYCKMLRNKFPGIDCYHGVGHATIQSMPLLPALAVCDKVVENNDNPSDCYRGAFSEYVNKLNGIDGDTDAPIPGVVPVKYASGHVFDECVKLPLKYQKACAAQFSSFIWDGSLDTSLPVCNTYPDWIAEICSFKSSEAFTTNNFEQMKIIEIPKKLSGMKSAVRKGYIEGSISGYNPYKLNDSGNTETVWCSSLQNTSDKNFCLSLIK